MNEIFVFIARSKAFILFALLEIFALWCVYRFNSHNSAVLFNTTSFFVAKVAQTQSSIYRYANLNSENEKLVKENARLNNSLAFLQNSTPKDTTLALADTSMAGRFTLEYADAINYTTSLRNNYITINRGAKDGITVGMGIVSPTGVVGKVKMVSPNMAIVTSILHSENLVSSKLKKTNKLGTIKWEGVNPYEVELQYIDMYEKITKGDTVVTSDLNAVFPGNIVVGTVKSVAIKPGQQYFKIIVNLSTDFKNLGYVYIVKNALIEEQTQLEASILPQKK